MDTKNKVSVIIPVYNGADYLEQTMSYVMNQTYNAIEIICVDDGSTDETFTILKRLQQEDNRIIIIQQEKQSYAGVARNKGMEKAEGKYLLFWDADDLMELHAIEAFVQKMEEDKADICVCNANQYDTVNAEYIKRNNYLQLKRIPEQIPFSIETNPQYIFNFTTNVPWNKMYRKEFVMEHQIQFQSLPRANDQYFVITCMALAKRITILDEVLISYRIKQKNNLTNEFSDTPFCTYEALLATKEGLDTLNLFSEEKVRQSFVNKTLNSLTYCLNIQTNMESYCELYYFLQKEGFEALGIKDYGEDYYYNVKVYMDFMLIKDKPHQEYLFIKNFEYRDEILLKNNKMNQLRTEKNEQKAELKKTKRELDRANKEIKNIKESRGYQMIEKLRKIKRFFKR